MVNPRRQTVQASRACTIKFHLHSLRHLQVNPLMLQTQFFLLPCLSAMCRRSSRKESEMIELSSVLRRLLELELLRFESWAHLIS